MHNLVKFYQFLHQHRCAGKWIRCYNIIDVIYHRKYKTMNHLKILDHTVYSSCDSVISMKGVIFHCSCIHYVMMASMSNVADVIVIFPTLYFVHTVNPLLGISGQENCWSEVPRCAGLLLLLLKARSLQKPCRRARNKPSLRENLTITEKAPKYTNGAISWQPRGQSPLSIVE